jgi:hypothetical protein
MQTSEDLENQAEVEQPGLSRLREAVANARQRLPGRATLVQDGLAGMNSTIGSAPDAMANAILAGVNPLYGLYAAMIGPPVGALFTSTQLMIISSTSAAALAANQSLTGLTGDARDRALFLMVILIGVFHILLGLLRAGQLTRFVSYSVMTGFLTGVAMLMVLSQFSTVIGIEATGSNKLTQALSVIVNIGQADWFTLGTALLALLLIIVLPRTPLGNLGPLVAIIVPSILVLILGWNSVQTVRDVGEIVGGFPRISLPSFSDFTPGMITGALAVALIVIVQGAGVSQSVPNPDGSRRSTSRDMIKLNGSQRDWRIAHTLGGSPFGRVDGPGRTARPRIDRLRRHACPGRATDPCRAWDHQASRMARDLGDRLAIAAGEPQHLAGDPHATDRGCRGDRSGALSNALPLSVSGRSFRGGARGTPERVDRRAQAPASTRG